MKYTGGCHCQKVRFEVEMTLDKGLSCNCSICEKRGHILTFVPEGSFKLLAGEGLLTDYQFARKNIHHYFCSTCGVGAFGAGKGPDGKKMRAINLRCLDGIDLKRVPLTTFDGKSL